MAWRDIVFGKALQVLHKLFLLLIRVSVDLFNYLSARIFKPECHLTVVIPSFLHEAAGAWLFRQYGRWGVKGLISDEADEAMIVLPSSRKYTMIL